MDCFDADVVIYGAAPDHPIGRQVAALFAAAAQRGLPAGVGSVLLLPEVLGKPLRDGAHDQVSVLARLLSRLDLRPVDRATADLAAVLSARYRLRAADAVHLATAVAIGADRFVTNNRREFSSAITEVDVTFSDALRPDG
jgi:predicted nucleic acid-binding protein